jgi:hypothetical protein
VELIEGPVNCSPTVAVSVTFDNVNTGAATAGLTTGEAVAGESPVRLENKSTDERNLKNEALFMGLTWDILETGISNLTWHHPSLRQARRGETKK